MKRKARFDSFKEAPSRGNYDEFPMLELGIDPQVHLSRNTLPQPFFLICEQDTVLAQLSGEARVDFRNSPVNFFHMVLGDYIYVPAGTPHRILPKSESIQLRYKARFPGLEAVAWYDERTGKELHRVTWDCAAELPQEAYQRACLARGIDVSPYNWAAVVAEIRETEAGEMGRLNGKGEGANAVAPRSITMAIGAADEMRPPLKSNVYLFARVATGALTPLFPYTEPGSIVPCTTLHELSSTDPMGYFIHTNTVHEVNVSFGTHDGYQLPGGCGVGPFRHGVGQKAGQLNPKLMNLAVITQRQSVGIPQREALGFACEACDDLLYEYEYDAHTFPGELEGEVDRPLIGLPTSSQSAVARDHINADEANRTCRKCGHVNPPFFESDYWGWNEYRRRTRVVAQAREIMRQASLTKETTVAN
jgi:hypothetical protein